MRVSKKSVVFLVFIFTMFLPLYFSNSIMKLVQNVALFGMVLILFQKRYTPSKVAFCTLIHFAFLTLLTFIYGHRTTDIHFVVSNIKIAICLFSFDFMIFWRKKDFVNILFWVLLCFVLADFISIILFPEGLYFVERHWNEWSTTLTSQWILGNKNERAIWYLMLQIITYMRYQKNKKQRSIIPGIISCISIIAAVMVRSTTSTIVMILVAVGVCLSYYSKKKVLKYSIDTKTIYFAIFIINILLVGGNFLLEDNSVFSSLIEVLFDKDLSSVWARKVAWGNVIFQIVNYPLGQGVIDSASSGAILGSLAYTDAHNMFLDLLWEGGLISLIMILIILFTIAKRTQRIIDKKSVSMIQFFIIAFFIVGLTESIMGQSYGWYCLMLLWCCTETLEYQVEDSAIS